MKLEEIIDKWPDFLPDEGIAEVKKTFKEEGLSFEWMGQPTDIMSNGDEAVAATLVTRGTDMMTFIHGLATAYEIMGVKLYMYQFSKRLTSTLKDKAPRETYFMRYGHSIKELEQANG
jgi:hypothetical protein